MPTDAPPAPPPMLARRAPSTAVAPKLGKAGGTFQPPRLVLLAVEGWGKTSAGAFAPSPAIVMARGETGFLTLLGQGRVPDIDQAQAEDWPSLSALLDEMISRKELPYKTLVFDALGGFERLCHEMVCARDFGGDWGEHGFTSYQTGYDVALTEWIAFLSRLDRLRNRGIAILLLGHAIIRPFKNPLGADFDRFISDTHHKTWNATARWADAVFFGNFRTITEKKGGRTKGIGGVERVLYAEHRDAFDAKNRYGCEPEIAVPDDHARVWATIWDAIRAGQLHV